MGPSLTHVSGTVTSDVECRFTDSGIAVCRFSLIATTSRWDAASRQWRDGAPIAYLCTAWRDLARHATESLTPKVTVLATGRITEIRDNTLHLSLDDLGISLHQRIAYTETSLPSPHAATPITPPTAPQPTTTTAAPGPATQRTGHPPAWWEEQRPHNRTRPGTPAAASR
ncbi:single-stranded DNA-binding protein [Streptomyces sp. NPDC093094]|uniref:single-stranded DNA-binding protein n=1 Tax=Streptomyces sp. NPDC093094 TaxID=3366026 RepID=UPI003812F02F